MKSAKIFWLLICVFPLSLSAQTTIPNSTTYTSGETLTVSDPVSITAGTGVTVSSGANITYATGGVIYLNPGFDAATGSTFAAYLPLGMPAGFTTLATGTATDSFSWTAPVDSATITSYHILRYGQLVGMVGGSSLIFSDTGLAASTSYSYTVVAFDSAGNDVSSAPYTIKTADDLEIFNPLP